jgi:Uma2 family endonuclease
MYHPKFDGPLVLQDDMGTYAPRIHQRIISKLDFGLRLLYQQEKRITLEPLPETMVNEDQASPTPDLILVDPITEFIHVVIEVCKTTGLKSDIRKVVDLLDNDLYSIKEGFIYDYKTGNWYRYKAGSGGLVEESSWSDVLALDLNTFLTV